MPVPHILIVLIVIGILLALIPMDGTIKNILLLLVVLMVVGMLLGFRVPGLN